MFKKYMAAGLIGSTMLASAAFAQTSTTPSTAPAAPVAASASGYTGNWRASKIVGLHVYNANNESLGSINDLLTDQNGNIKAVVVGVGGFLGVGEHLVAVPFDRIKFSNTPVVTTSASSGSTGGAGGMSGTSTVPSSGVTTGAAPATTATKPNPWYPDHAILNTTKDELKAMTEFKYST